MRLFVEPDETIHGKILESVGRIGKIGPSDFQLVDFCRLTQAEMRLGRILMSGMTGGAKDFANLLKIAASNRDSRADRGAVRAGIGGISGTHRAFADHT